MSQVVFIFHTIMCVASLATTAVPTVVDAGSHPLLQHLNTKPDMINPRLLVPAALASSKKFEGSSSLVQLQYHMGPVLSSLINLHLIWYGKWSVSQKKTILGFLESISPANAAARAATRVSVSEWWSTVSLYTDQTGANVSRTLRVSGQYDDAACSHGTDLTRLSFQRIIASAVKSGRLPADHENGVYLILTSPGITVQDFCRAACGFHYFTFPSAVGYTLPFAWIGNSAEQCPEVCAYPFAIPTYMMGGGPGKLKPPNGDLGVDGMVSVIGHELAELATNPLINAWYAGGDPTAPTEIGDLCEGVYGTGGGGGYMGQVMRGKKRMAFNLNGVGGRKYLVQWIWNPISKACSGPNALD